MAAAAQQANPFEIGAGETQERSTPSQSALRLEVEEAVSRKKTKKPLPPDLSWVFQQCPGTRSGTGSELFRLYDGGEEVSFLEKQTYRQWKSLNGFQRLAHPRRLRNTTITIIPVAHSSSSCYGPNCQIDTAILRRLKDFCDVFFLGMNVELGCPVDLAGAKRLTSRVHLDTQREQFLVGDILSHLKAHRPRKAYTVVGVTMVDLYPSPEWNFVLGHASLTNGSAVISFGRYFADFAANGRVGVVQQLQNLWILLRVLTHELCHTFGMKHCYYFRCAMNESSSIQQAAAQPLFLCPVCLRKLRKALKFSVLERYHRMLRLCRELYQEVLDSYCHAEPIKEDSGVGVHYKTTERLTQVGSHSEERVTSKREQTLPACDARVCPVSEDDEVIDCSMPQVGTPPLSTGAPNVSHTGNRNECVDSGAASSTLIPTCQESKSCIVTESRICSDEERSSLEVTNSIPCASYSLRHVSGSCDGSTTPEHQLRLFREAIVWLEQSTADATAFTQRYPSALGPKRN